ncbi:MAG: hypothetical protein RLZZ127_2913, partial [Planctomycetota bacterium]
AAASPGGVLGPVRAGTSLQFAYVSGEWAPEERMGRGSPDRDPRLRYRLVIAQPDGRVVSQIPTGTAGKPFTWTASQDFERLQLRILRPAPGVGTVRYRMTLIPPMAAASPKPKPAER